MVEFNAVTNGTDVVKAFEGRVKGRTFLVTGPSPSGIGAATVTALATASPALLILLGRSKEKCQPVLDSVAAIDPSIRVQFHEVDTSDLQAVRRVADTILSDPTVTSIDAIINNAGVMGGPLRRSREGHEYQLATNHLGPFVLTNKLIPRLAPGGTVVNVSSFGHKYSDIQWSDPDFLKPDSYDPNIGYSQSKTAMVLHATALVSRGVRAFGLNPGWIEGTGLAVNSSPEEGLAMINVIVDGGAAGLARIQKKTVDQGSSTQLRAALDPSLDPADGVYMNDCVQTQDPFWTKPYAWNKESAERLWKLTEELVGETFTIGGK